MIRNAKKESSLNHLLPGRSRIERGTFADYRALEHFHYAPGRPAAPVGVWRVVYVPSSGRRDRNNSQFSIGNFQFSIERLIAVGVLAFPTPSSRARERTLQLCGPRYGPKLAFVNAHVRTIARVIVHPQFRGLGVAARLVRRICDECPTRYVEAFAAMGEVHPLFERGGMRRVPPQGGEEGAYFIFDRENVARSE